jgi:perosamine synthetase
VAKGKKGIFNMIPVCEPTLKGNELKYVEDCLTSNWIGSSGKYIQQFEKLFSEFCNTNHAITCSNGTTALHLALRAIDIKQGDEVIVPDFTMMSCVDSILYTNAKPVFVDAQKDTWNIDVEKIEEKITNKTKAIMVVHIYGHPVDMDRVLEIAEKNNLFIIEDCAEAHGATYKNKMIGSLGDISCFSFYSNKIVTTGEGGMVITNNDKFAEKIRLLKNLAFKEPRFVHDEMGYNYRMTNIQAAIGVAQMEYIDELVEFRRKNAQMYNDLLKNVEGITLPVEKEWAKNVYWMYSILIEDSFGLNMSELRKKLLEKGIDTRSFFMPMHSQPIVLKLYPKYKKEDSKYPISNELSKKGLYLPSSSSLSHKEIKKVCDTIKEIKEEIKK